MNQLLSYEKQIADKMQLADVPDMQDAVWSRIEAMLDADINAQQTETTKQEVKTKDTLFSKKRITIAVIILALLLAIAINKQKRNSALKKENSGHTLPQRTDTVFRNEQELPLQKESIIKKSSSNQMNPLEGSGKLAHDSMVIVPTEKGQNTSVQKIDSSNMFKPVEPLLPKKDTVMKKPRGVTGISDTDYKFVMPKKDSTNK
jgi:hypothetical protein